EPRVRLDAHPEIHVAALRGRAHALAVPDAGGEPHLDGAVGPAWSRQRHAAWRPGEGFLERKGHLVVDRRGRAACRRTLACRAASPRRAAPRLRAAEERLEEVGEGALVTEELLDLLGIHRPSAAGTTHVERP